MPGGGSGQRSAGTVQRGERRAACTERHGKGWGCGWGTDLQEAPGGVAGGGEILGYRALGIKDSVGCGHREGFRAWGGH